MVNPSKARGTRFESQVCEYLRTHGYPLVERRALRGNKDCGDIAGVFGWVLECKAAKKFELAEWVKEAESELGNALGTPWWAVIIKRPRKPIHKAYVVMDLEEFAEQRFGSQFVCRRPKQPLPEPLDIGPHRDVWEPE
jgi:hypothetical protein